MDEASAVEESSSDVVTDESSNSVEKDITAKIFACPEQSCTKEFVRLSALERHCEFGMHKRALETMTLHDLAKFSYAKHLEEGQTRKRTQLMSTETFCDQNCPCPKGWALKKVAKKTRFSEQQRSYLTEKFMEGERTKKKATGEEVAKDMRKVRKSDGTRMFRQEEFLTDSQISSFFSRLAAQRKNLTEEDYEAQNQADILREVTDEITTAVGDQLQDSTSCFYFDGVCLCGSKSEIKKLKLPTLKAICKEYGLKTKGTRKVFYVEAVTEAVANCPRHSAAQNKE